MKPLSVRASVVGAVALAAVVGGAAPASADCVYAVVYVTRQGDPPVYVSNGCVYSTPWTWFVSPNSNGTTGGLPQHSPNGYFLDIRVPSPV